MKTFVFGRTKNDPKGSPAEHGTVAVAALSRSAALLAFLKAKGDSDPRQHIVRLPVEGQVFDEHIDLKGDAAKRPPDEHIVYRSGATAAGPTSSAAPASTQRKRAPKKASA